MFRFLRLILLLIFAAVLGGIGYFNSTPILTAIGESMVEADPLEKAQAALVLAGDFHGLRILRAGDLAREGYVPIVLVSGPMGLYGVNEADLAVRFAVSKGYDASIFEAVEQSATSTQTEAEVWRKELSRRKIHKLMLVTSNFHTKRAARTFRAMLGTEVQIISVAAPYPYFTPDTWWRSREGQKIAFMELIKAAAFQVGL